MSESASNISPGTSPGPNKTIPGMPNQVQATVPSLAQAMQLVLQGLQVLAGQRGSTITRAVTFDDLIRLQLITAVQASSLRGATTVGNTTTITNADLQNALSSVFGSVDGTIIVRTSANWVALTPGAEGDVLKIVSGVPAWAAP